MNTTIPTKHVLKTAKVIAYVAYAIAAIGAVGSYGTQAFLLLANGVGWFSWVIPATVDLLAFASAMALSLPGLGRGRWVAGAILLASVTVSVTANVAGGHNTIARVAHAWPVVAYLLGELLAGIVRSYAARLAATAPVGTNPSTTTQVSVPDTAAELVTPGQLPEAPVSPAPARPRKRTIAERMAAGEDIRPSERTARRYRTGK
jgi:uncharacterized protein DUF2637